MLFLLVFIYFSIAAFTGLSVYRVYCLVKMPLHGRWEIYPVPGEPGERGRYGGSYYEEVEWWNKPRRVSRAGKIMEALKEILFIRKLFVNQRRQWWLSYTMHLGIYLSFLWAVLLLTGVLMELSGLPLKANVEQLAKTLGPPWFTAAPSCQVPPGC